MFKTYLRTAFVTSIPILALLAVASVQADKYGDKSMQMKGGDMAGELADAKDLLHEASGTLDKMKTDASVAKLLQGESGLCGA